MTAGLYSSKVQQRDFLSRRTSVWIRSAQEVPDWLVQLSARDLQAADQLKRRDPLERSGKRSMYRLLRRRKATDLSERVLVACAEGQSPMACSVIAPGYQ
jgi:hypothetical protein